MSVLRGLSQGFSVIFLTISVLVFFFQSLVVGFITGSIPYQYSDLMIATIQKQGYTINSKESDTQEDLYTQLIDEFKKQSLELNKELEAQQLDGDTLQQKLKDGTLEVKSADITDEGWQILRKIKNVPYEGLTSKQQSVIVKEPAYVKDLRLIIRWLPVVLIAFSVLLIYLGWWALVPYTEDDELWDELSEAYDRKQRYIHSED